MKRIVILVWAGFALIGSPALADEMGNVRNGAAFAEAACSTCHAVRPRQDRSPNSKAPSFERVAAMPGMTWTALHAWLVTPHPTMPNLILSAGDKDDLAAYILSLKRKH